MSAAFCTKCGRRLSPGDSFCTVCGERVAGPKSFNSSPYSFGPPAPPESDNVAALVVVIVVIVAAATIVGSLAFGALAGRGFCNCPGDTPIGTALSLGAPVAGRCPIGDTFAENGCQGPTDFYYRMSIATSTVTFGSVWFFVQRPSGAVDVTPAGLGFTILTEKGTVAAQYAVVGGSMGMSSDWSYGSGFEEGTPVSTSEYVVIDMGPQNPTGQGLELVAQGMSSYTGTTNPLALP